MMADFLQHLGDIPTQRRFLESAFESLRPGGWFFLSFFNINIKHRLKHDIEGSFAEGAIRYRRLTARLVRSMLPEVVTVDRVIPVNTFHDVVRDRMAAKLPFVGLLARWMILARPQAGYRVMLLQ